MRFASLPPPKAFVADVIDQPAVHLALFLILGSKVVPLAKGHGNRPTAAVASHRAGLAGNFKSPAIAALLGRWTMRVSNSRESD